MEAHQEQNELEWLRVAQLACWVTAPHVKKPVKPEQLIRLNKASQIDEDQKAEDVKRKLDFLKRHG